VKVKFSPRAESEAEAKARWWRNKRQASPELFDEELAEALDAIRQDPTVGATYPRPRYPLPVFFLLSKVLDVFLGPYAWGLLLLAAAVPWGPRAARRWRRRRAFGVAALVVLLLGGMSPLAHAIQWRLEHADPATYRPEVTYDAVVLLGGLVDEESSAENGRPAYTDAVERMLVTYDLLREGRARVAIVSAAPNPDFPEHGEAAVVARQLEAWGIAKDRILVEDRARNTRENAVYSQQIARERGISRVVVVTSAFHMTRAAECFAAVDMPVDTLPVDYRAHAKEGASFSGWIPRGDGLSDMTGALRAAFGRVVYRVRGFGKATR
jgi:uncharacterized SAM-binding protein YcdF (DUF218 family)